MKAQLITAMACSALVVSACTTSSTSTDQSAVAALPEPEQVEVVTDNDFLEGLRKAYESAYNALPLEEEVSYGRYQALFSFVFNQAADNGIIMRRNPVLSADGFVLTEEQKDTFGHSLLVEMITATETYCLASTQAVSPDYVPEPQRSSIAELPHEFIILKGSCAPHASLLELAASAQ